MPELTEERVREIAREEIVKYNIELAKLQLKLDDQTNELLSQKERYRSPYT